MPRVSSRVRRARFSRKEVVGGSEGGGSEAVGCPEKEMAFSVSGSMIRMWEWIVGLRPNLRYL